MSNKGLATVLLAGTLLAGCGQEITTIDPDLGPEERAAIQAARQTETEPEDAEPRTVPRLLLQENIHTLDPRDAADYATASALNMTGEGLYRSNKDGEPELALLEKDPEHIDEQTLRFTLRADNRWSNGESVTAEDVAAGWRALVDPEHHHPAGNLLDDWVANAAAIQKGEQAAETLGVEVIDERSFDVHLVAADVDLSALKQLLTRVELFPLPTHALTDDYGTTSAATVSNGPYTITGWRELASDQWTFRKNPYYPREADYPLKAIAVQVANDPDALATYQRTQLADWLPSVDVSAAPNETTVLQFQLPADDAPDNILREPEVRQLLFAALDLEASALPDGVTLASHLSPYVDVAAQSFATNKAADEARLNELLDQNDYAALELTILTGRDATEQAVAQMVKTELETAYQRVVVGIVPISNENLTNHYLERAHPSPKALDARSDLIVRTIHAQALGDDYSFYQPFADATLLNGYSPLQPTLESADVEQIEQALADAALVYPLYHSHPSFAKAASVAGELQPESGYLYDFRELSFMPGDLTVPLAEDGEDTADALE